LPKFKEATNLYSIKVSPNKPTNCTAYGTQKFPWICFISSFTPVTMLGTMCWAHIW